MLLKRDAMIMNSEKDGKGK